MEEVEKFRQETGRFSENVKEIRLDNKQMNLSFYIKIDSTENKV